MLHFLLQHVQDLALDVLCDLFLGIPALLKPVEELGVVASKKHHQLEPALGEEVARVELKDDAAALRHEGLQLVADHILVELRHVELLVPLLVQLFLCY